jgi:hypothetical protein
MVVTQEMLERISAIMTPHMRVVSDDIAAAFPDSPDRMYAVALTIQFTILLDALPPTGRTDAIGIINQFLSAVDCRLVSTLS